MGELPRVESGHLKLRIAEFLELKGAILSVVGELQS
jgi:hypothetical protein